MNNEDLYKSGLLFELLKEKNLTTRIKDYLDAEYWLLDKLIHGGKVLDLGCGFGRHLRFLSDRIEFGVGVDISKLYLNFARSYIQDNICLVLADINNFEWGSKFDYVICMNNTFGNVDGYIMRKKISDYGWRGIISVHSDKSVEDKLIWYKNSGLEVSDVTKDYIKTKEGFISHHFNKQRLKQMFPTAKIGQLTDFGYFVILDP